MDYKMMHCPNCNGELHVPTELNTCICMYCGERIPLIDQGKEAVPAAVQEKLRINYEEALEKIDLLVKDYDRIITYFTRTNYSTSFENYGRTTDELLLSVEQYATSFGVDLDHVIHEVAGKLISFIDTDINQSKGMLSGSSKAKAIDQYRFFITVYLIPRIRSRMLTISEPLSDSIISEWGMRYPKYEFKKASYEEILKGFERKGFCFITSAVCDTMNKPDDCYELTAFRAFRDTYMQQTQERLKLVSQYYELAPIIVTYINYCTDRNRIYDTLWKQYLKRCLKAIEAKKYDICEKYYTKMIYELKEKVPLGFEI